MHLVLRLTRLPVASTFPEIYSSHIHRQHQFRQKCGIHLYAPLSCRTKLKVNTTQQSPQESTDPIAPNARSDQKQTTPTTPFATTPSLQAFSPKSTSNEPQKTAKGSSSNDQSGRQPQELPAPPPNPPKPKLSREAVRQNVRGYVFTRYFDYVKNYDKVLEKNFPGAFKLYRVFFDGVSDFYSDMKRYLKVWRIANSSPDGLRALNRKELELYMQMPRDMVKVAPALLGTSLPMIGYAFFPLVFMYPRRFLTSHFWTLQQRNEFQQLQLQERFNHNRPVFRCLQAKLKTVRKHEKHEEFSNLLGLIGSGFHPSVEAILNIKDIFATSPYNLQSLSGKHIKHLNEMHGLPGSWSKRFRLREHAFLVHHMDLAIGREGGAHNMPLDAMQKSCAIRGLNPANMSKDDMIVWLKDWIQVSTSIQEDHISLFLHLPIFLAYNHPNNWKLIYSPNLKASNNTTNASNTSAQ